MCDVFSFKHTATTEIYTLSLHDALPISSGGRRQYGGSMHDETAAALQEIVDLAENFPGQFMPEFELGYRARSEEHTSELQSQFHLVCRLLLEKKKTI